MELVLAIVIAKPRGLSYTNPGFLLESVPHLRKGTCQAAQSANKQRSFCF
jgi:hypothetical protein